MMKTNSRKWLFSLLIVACLCVVGGVIFKLAYDFNTDRTEQKWYKDTAPKITYDENDDNTDNGIGELIEENPDCVAWVRVEKTKIDYPIMQTKNNPEYYLRRNFNKEYSYIGTPFLDAECDIETSQNLIIYGHNMNNDTMFGTLDSYYDYDYAVSHQDIVFSAPDGERVYRVFAAFQTRVYSDRDDVFKYYEEIGSLGQDEYEQTVEAVRGMPVPSLPDAPEYPAQLLFLSTCSYHTDDGRFIVAAYRTK
jgi:sortase B